MSAKFYKLPVKSGQLPHFRRQASLFCSALKRELGIETKKSNQLNLFAKVCGYSSFATLQKQCYPDAATTDPLFLTESNTKRDQLVHNIRRINSLEWENAIAEAGFGEVVDKLLAVLPVPTNELDLFIEGKDRHFGLATIQLYTAPGLDWGAEYGEGITYEFDGFDALIEATELSFIHIRKKLADWLKEKVGISSALLFHSETMGSIDEGFFPEFYPYSVANKLLELKNNEVIELVNPDGPQQSESGDVGGGVYVRLLPIRLYLIFESEQPIKEGSEFLDIELSTVLTEWMSAKSNWEPEQRCLFGAINFEGFFTYDWCNDDEMLKELPGNGGETITANELKEAFCIWDEWQYFDEDFCEMAMAYLDKYPDEQLGFSLGEDEFTLGHLILTNKGAKLLLREYAKCGNGGGEVNSGIYNLPKKIIGEPEVFFEKPGFEDSLIDDEWWMGNIPLNENKVHLSRILSDCYYPAINNCMSNYAGVGFEKSKTPPWAGHEKRLEESGARYVVVDILCESQGDRECLFIVSFCDDKKLIAQSAHSVAIVLSDDKEYSIPIYDELKKLEQRFHVCRVYHEVSHPQFVQPGEAFGYTPPANAMLAGKMGILFEIEFEHLVDDLEIKPILGPLLKRIASYGMGHTDSSGMGMAYHPRLIPSLLEVDYVKELLDCLFVVDSEGERTLEDVLPSPEAYRSSTFMAPVAVYVDWMSNYDLLMAQRNLSIFFRDDGGNHSWLGKEFPILETYQIKRIRTKTLTGNDLDLAGIEVT